MEHHRRRVTQILPELGLLGRAGHVHPEILRLLLLLLVDLLSRNITNIVLLERDLFPYGLGPFPVDASPTSGTITMIICAYIIIIPLPNAKNITFTLAITYSVITLIRPTATVAFSVCTILAAALDGVQQHLAFVSLSVEIILVAAGLDGGVPQAELGVLRLLLRYGADVALLALAVASAGRFSR